VILFAGLTQIRFGKYEKSITRSTNSIQEELAITAAENTNYSEIFKINSAYATKSGYVAAGVLKYDEERFEALKGKLRDMKFIYAAKVSLENQISVVYIPKNEDASLSANAVRIMSQNGSILDDFNNNGMFAHRNESGIQKIDPSLVDFDFSDCYVVRMHLRYSEAEWNSEYFDLQVSQTVILDRSYKPQMICIIGLMSAAVS
jgi:hypothetical protein